MNLTKVISNENINLMKVSKENANEDKSRHIHRDGVREWERTCANVDSFAHKQTTK